MYIPKSIRRYSCAIVSSAKLNRAWSLQTQVVNVVGIFILPVHKAGERAKLLGLVPGESLLTADAFTLVVVLFTRHEKACHWD